MTKNENKKIHIPTEIYSRVVGYYRPVNKWNKGKQAEFSDRQYVGFEKIAAQ